MRILIHGINYSPELTGIGKYSGEMAEWLAARGHEVRVVTAPPYYPEWRVGKGYSAWWYKRQGSCVGGGGIAVYRCPLWVPARPSGVKRLLHLASFALSSFPVLLRQIFWKPDVVLVIEPPLMCAPASVLVAHLCGARSWLHIQDFEVDAAFDMGILPPDKLRDVVLKVERVLMRAFDRVSTISPNMLARVVEKGVDPARAVLFPNWVDTETIYPLDGVSALRAELGITADRIVALYSGNMGEKQGLEVVLEVASKMQGARCKGQEDFAESPPSLTLPLSGGGDERCVEDKCDAGAKLEPCDLNLEPDVLFVLCGDGAARQRLMARYPDLPNVMWLPLQPVERLNELLNMADIHLLPQRADVADLVMPSKLTGMLASGKPIVATAHPGTQVARVVSTCGVVCAPGDADALLDAIISLVADSELRRKMGKVAREYALAHLGKVAVLTAFESQLQGSG